MSPNAIRESALGVYRAKNKRRTNVYRLSSKTRVIHVNTETWTCSCLRFLMWCLLCRHIRKVPENYLGFASLPTKCIRARWNVYRAMSLTTAILRSAGNLSGLDERGSHILSVPPPLEPPRNKQDRVEYAKLRKRESKQFPVLSECKKHSVMLSELASRASSPVLPRSTLRCRRCRFHGLERARWKTSVKLATTSEAVDYDNVDVDDEVDAFAALAALGRPPPRVPVRQPSVSDGGALAVIDPLRTRQLRPRAELVIQVELLIHAQCQQASASAKNQEDRRQGHRWRRRARKPRELSAADQVTGGQSQLDTQEDRWSMASCCCSPPSIIDGLAE
ncbi:hypothetical protein PybrP1_009116 [[Pythium] brassicae (nom. inval.)]|nr:hypothetical protein PybrP1_009116 [[Pythium] brassicae (nom. inval.)]